MKHTPMSGLAHFKSFKSFTQTRARADHELATNSHAAKSPGGALLLLGRDSAMLRRLAHVAIQVEGANLKSVISNPTPEQASNIGDTSCVIVIDINGNGDAPAVSPNIGSSIYVRASSESREETLVDNTSHEFIALPGTDEEISVDFTRLVKVLRCPPGPVMGPGTYYVSLTFPDVTEAMSCGEEWTPPEWSVSQQGDSLHNALEVRVDLLKSQDEDFVLSQLALVRRRSDGLPIIYTVRTKIQGGAFPDDEEYAWQLMATGLRFGVEYVDVEAGFSRQGRYEFLKMAKDVHRGLRVIGSFHDIQRPLSIVPDCQLDALFAECAYGPEGSVDIVKVVCRANSAQCNIRINQAAQKVRPTLPSSVSGMIAICTSEVGRLSRALNIMMGPTPVAHPALPGKAAPGQLSAVEIEEIRLKLGLNPNPFWTFSDPESAPSKASESPSHKRRKYVQNSS